ncbi:hypothetical protein [Paraburkholderia sacchari]|uniref:hypothetical protein n=1 Tax=Paraburkholderia sacchari TaxID=159450 RepID=UPI000542B010|nr:hypothetical protein [Paraburkholderia sacchari]NLP65530.1 hypothetical protein [Paraburkholderia sacchari]
MAQQLILIDDGVFYIERNVNGDAAVTNGFLLRRCKVGVTTPGGYECIGGYERAPSGMWRASINVPYDAITDSDSYELGDTFGTNRDAIAALWKSRHEAHCQH